LSDPAVALLTDGALAAAVEQKKIARRHRPGEFPEEAVEACLALGRVTRDQVDTVAIVRPFAAGPEAQTHLELRAEFPNARIVIVEHHAAHAASAYFASPFQRATVLTLDRQGDFRCGARWKANGARLELDKELYLPDSLGDLYGRVTGLLGFDPNAEEHKVQWMSTAGGGRFTALFEEILGSGNGGWPRFDRAYFDGERVSRGGFSARFYQRLGLADNAAIPEEL
ncbi:MAG TPA: carbamoyltransferase, partial [Solibacterales bacterium]|nr:carbamoyltransferase [Bryobacterales bacterium]